MWFWKKNKKQRQIDEIKINSKFGAYLEAILKRVGTKHQKGTKTVVLVLWLGCLAWIIIYIVTKVF
jgi:hypothetical protein